MMDTSVKADESRNSSMPRDGDNKLKLFEKIVYFTSGSIGDEALMVLKNSNAESTRLLSDSVTHCIVGKNYVEADVSAARELYDVTTVTPEWIRMSVLCNKLLPTKPFNPFEDNIFSGIIVCVSQQIVNDCKILWALVTYNGGTFQLTLNLKKTTHLVVTKPFGKKYDAVLSSGSDKIKIVTPDWIIDCLKNKELCPETNYHPRLLVMPKLLPTNQSFKLQTSGLSTITGFADFDAPVEQPGGVVPKNQGLEQLKQRLPWNQPPTPPTSQPVHTSSSQVTQGTSQSNTNQLKPMMSLMSTPQLQRLSQQQVQQLQLQQQTHANNQLLSQQQMHIPQQQNQFQQQIRTQQMQQSKQIQLQHGQQLQYQPNQQQIQQTHMQSQQGQQTHLQIMQKGQQQTLQQNQQHIQMQQKVQQLQSIPGQQLQNQQQVVLQQQNVQIQSGQQQQQNVQQLQSSQQPNQIPLLQQQTVQIQQGQLPQLQPQSVQIQQGQPQQQQVQMPQLQQQTVQLQQGQQQQGQLAQLQKQTVQLQQNPQHSNQLQQGQQIQPQQIQFQTSNSQQVQFPQQVTQNTQVHLQQQQQQQQQPQLQNVQSTQSSQICIVSNGQQLQQTQANPSNQQQQLLLQQQQRLMFQQRIVQQGGGTVSTQWRMAHPPSNMPRVQVNQQQSQQIQQQQTLVIGQQPTVNMNNANTQPTTQTQWPPQQTLTIQRTIQQPMDQRQVIWSQQSPHGPQQMIHMDAKTHQQIQAMNPAERIAFINKLTKQRNLVLQQFNARQQQAAGVAGGTNIVRPSTTPNGQTTVIRTLNHQLISSTGMTPTQQAQWNQIRQQQLLAQQQQQQQQQMAGGTVTTGLPTNAKTVSNTLVNNQQVVQPQTTVWQQSPVTEQGHQQTTGSMSAVQLAQIHQRQQQLQQLRLQQLQMDASQKQQTMQQQVAPNQAPIAGVMQTNVVQSPQVAAAQTSIVQPQQTPTLPTNEQTETQTPSQEPFPQTSQSNQQALVVNPKTKTALANMLSIRLQNGISSSTSTQQQQMSGQEISAAGQLRLMTAQHHAAQQSSTQGTYQSRTVLNNVTNNTATNRTAQVVGRAAVPTAVASKTLPANYNQSAAVRVAAVLAKSAAGQTVGHQQLPHQARFFGHNPNLKLPPDKCLLGCIFLIVEYDRCPDTVKEVPTWKQIILDHGGEIEPSYTLRLTHILCQTQKHPLVQQGLRDGKRCITAYWLSDIITKQQLMPPWYALHFPTPYSEERPCRQMLISLTNFESDERNRVKFMIELTGARVTSYFSADNNILVTRKLEGKKVKKARDINRPVVNVQWLNEILFGHLSCMYQPENVKYQQFNLNNPFRVDYNLVLHLMGAWKMPINVTQESYDRVRNNHIPIKRKRPRPNANFPDQENNDLSTADIIITNINPPPIEYRPCVMLSGFGLGKEEQRMVLQLGGTIAKNYSDATHLVMKESVRTTKFLCCVSTVKHIVNAEWLKDSSTQHMFLGEAIYTIEEVSVDQKVICKVHKILSNPNRHELFKGKIFYVTPGVTHPSVFIVRQIIESAGGTVEKQRRSLRAIQELEPNTYIVIASNNDLHLVSDLIRSSYGIYSSEFVLSAVMTQYVNYDMAYKKAKKIIN